MSATTAWVRFRQVAGQGLDGAELVTLAPEKISELISQARMIGRSGAVPVHIMLDAGPDITEHYVPRTPPATPPGPGAATAARLRALADIVELLNLPASALPAITLAFDEIPPAAAAALAAVAADACGDSRQRHTGGMDAAAWYGNRQAPPVLVEFHHVDRTAVFCERCGAPEPRDDFQTLRRPVPPGTELPPNNEVPA